MHNIMEIIIIVFKNVGAVSLSSWTISSFQVIWDTLAPMWRHCTVLLHFLTVTRQARPFGRENLGKSKTIGTVFTRIWYLYEQCIALLK